MRLYKVIERLSHHDVKPSTRLPVLELKRLYNNIAQFDLGNTIQNLHKSEFDDLWYYGKELYAHGLWNLPYENVSFSQLCDNGHRVVVVGKGDPEKTTSEYIGYAFQGDHNGIYENGIYFEIKNSGTALDGQWLDPTVDGATEQYFRQEANNCWALVLVATGLLMAKGAEIRTTKEPVALNKKRIKKGKLPIKEIHEIIIRVGSNVMRADGTSSEPGSTKRMHWRRGHIRRLASGEITNVRPCLVGAISTETKAPSLPSYRIKAA